MDYEIKPGKYRHFKGKEYEVIGVAAHSESLEPMVVYRQLYGEGGLWVRPASMWNETEKYIKDLRRWNSRRFSLVNVYLQNIKPHPKRNKV